MKLATTVLVLCVGALLALGLVMLYSARMAQGIEPVAPREVAADQGGAALDAPAPVKPRRQLVTSEQYLTSQLAYCGLGFAALLAGAWVDHRLLRRLAWPCFVVSAVLLILVLVPGLGHRVNGARRWVFHFQPSELAKLALVLVFAHYAASQARHMGRFLQGFVVPGTILGGMLVLIFLEPDWGTTLLLATVGVAMLYLGGTRLRYLAPAVLLGAAAGGFLLRHNPVRMARMMAFLDLETYKTSVGYQTWQAILALGAGGWDGLGLGNGRQKLGFVPFNQTDFILSVIGEELGVVATLAVVVAFVVLILCGFYISSRCRNMFGFLLGAGITMVIGLQAFINIGVVTSILPNKGLPLPFVSYGGSNLVTMLAGVGLLIGLARRAEEEDGRNSVASEEHDMPEENQMISVEKASSLPY